MSRQHQSIWVSQWWMGQQQGWVQRQRSNPGRQWKGHAVMLLPLMTSALLTTINSQPAKAQSITPAIDGTGTIVIPNGNQTNISGGQLSQDGTNLFHSFTQFGLTQTQIANFLSNPNIQNILGRVVGGNASIINGRIQVSGSNANLFLMNPAGIVFGANASLNVPASFTATTADAIGFGNGQWFNTIGSNNYTNLVGTPNAFAFTTLQPGAIVNAGNLAVNSGQSLTFLGGTVINTGTLTAPDGQITLTAVPGENLIRLSQSGNLLSLEFHPITASVTSTSPASLAQILTGGNLSSVTGLTVNPDGTIHLTSSGVQIPTTPGTAIVSGSVSVANTVSSSQFSASAPSITILGNQVGLVGATIDATGIQQGGTVRIGGDYQGKGTLPNATQTYVSRDSTINASALTNGHGGQVFVWADKATAFYGSINAQGGTASGNGGFVEVSGKETLTYRGDVNVSAAQGNPGTLVLDPTNITIINGAGGADDGQITDGQIFQADGGATSFTISENALQALGGNTTVILQATNNITINDLADNELTFAAGTGSITFQAGGLFSMNAGDVIRADGRNLTIRGDNITTGSIDTSSVAGGAGSITLIAKSVDLAKGNITTGRLSAVASDSNIATAKFGGGGDITLDATGSIIVSNNLPNNTNLASFSNSGNGGNIILSAVKDISLSNCSPAICVLSFAGGNTNSGFITIPGNSGNVTLKSTAGSIKARGATINTSTGRPGVAGYIDIFAYGDVEIDNLWSRGEADNPVITGQYIRVKSETGIIDTRGGFIDTGGSADFQRTPGSYTAAPITFEAAGNIYTAQIDASGKNAGGTVTLISRNGSVDTTAGIIGNYSPNGNGGNFIVNAAGKARLGEINATGQTGGGTLDFTGSDIIFSGESLNLGSDLGNPGTLILNTPGLVQLPAQLSTNRASILSNQPLVSLVGLAAGSTIDTGGGNLTLPFANSFTLDPSLSILTNGGNITITSPGTLTINTPLTTASTTSNGGNIILTSSNSLTVNAPLTTTSTTGNSGFIELKSDNATVATQNLTTAGNSGGNVTVKAVSEIRTGQINTSASAGDGGNVLLDPQGNVAVEWINTQAPNGQGGNVDITTGRFFQATGTFSALNGLDASISTADSGGGGSITITHDGGARLVSFNIGNLLENGTVGVLTTGNNTIAFGQSYLGPYTQGNISLITSPQAAIVPEALPTKPLGLGDGGTKFPLEELYTREFEQFDNRLGETKVLTLEEMQTTLRTVEDNTGVRPALIYVSYTPVPASTPTDCEPGKTVPDPTQPGKTKPCECIPVELPPDPDGWIKKVAEYDPLPCDRLTLTLVTSSGKPVYIPLSKVPRHKIEVAGVQFREAVQTKNSYEERYQIPGAELYSWLVQPLQIALKEREIGNLSFLMPARLRLIPTAALIDENQKFLAETYSSGLMPSLSLVDTRKVELKPTQLLAMGASTFKPDQQASPLPFVETELQSIVPALWRGRLYLNQQFTFSNLAISRRTAPYGMVHLATHGVFGEAFPHGMVQLWDQKLEPEQIRRLEWQKPPLEMLVLSACRTAYGDRLSELGFAGAASRLGVKSILGSLWYISDSSTSILMQDFYKHLKDAPTKADALAAAQQEMIKRGFNHPYYWSAFTLVGNPW